MDTMLRVGGDRVVKDVSMKVAKTNVYININSIRCYEQSSIYSKHNSFLFILLQCVTNKDIFVPTQD